MILDKTIYRTYVWFPKIKTSSCPVPCIRKLSSTQSNHEDGKFRGKYDVIIAGGGMVGCTLACIMGKKSLLSKLKVLLLEGSPDKKFTLAPEYSNRVVALSQNTKSLMNSINVWSQIEKMRVQPIRHMQVWDACSDALITFSSADILDDDVAYIVENDVLLHAVNTELKSPDIKNVDVVYGAKIQDYELPSVTKGSNESIVKLSNGDIYSCELLVGADGANSAVRKAMGVQYLSWNYGQMGVVATLHLAEETENTTAWQRFLPSGPIALLPLDSRRSSLVWTTSNLHAKELLELSQEQFVDALNDALWKQYPRSSTVDACTSWVGSWLKRMGLPDGAQRQLPPSIRDIVPGSRAAFPLGFGHSTRYIAPGVVLVGDAAHRVHPLAGQGVNLGFGDVKDLTDLLAESMYTGLDITKDVSNHSAWNILDKFDCGYSVADRIIGGDFAALGQFPWVTRLGFITQFNDVDWPCGGALLTDQHVLTAAHCLTPPPDIQLSVIRMGEFNMLTNPDCERGVCAPPIQDRRVKTVIIHPLYNIPSFANDIGIIVLDSPVQLNDYVTPICLPKGELLTDLPIGEYITAAGWGKTNMTTEEKADRLKFVALPIVQPEACNYFGRAFRAGPSHICAGGKINEDACGGDSGGPLIKVFDTFEGPKSFAVGVVSFGPTICGTNRPAVYTKVSNFIEWILDNIEQTY